MEKDTPSKDNETPSLPRQQQRQNDGAGQPALSPSSIPAQLSNQLIPNQRTVGASTNPPAQLVFGTANAYPAEPAGLQQASNMAGTGSSLMAFNQVSNNVGHQLSWTFHPNIGCRLHEISNMGICPHCQNFLQHSTEAFVMADPSWTAAGNAQEEYYWQHHQHNVSNNRAAQFLHCFILPASHHFATPRY